MSPNQGEGQKMPLLSANEDKEGQLNSGLYKWDKRVRQNTNDQAHLGTICPVDEIFKINDSIFLFGNIPTNEDLLSNLGNTFQIHGATFKKNL